MLRKNHNSQFLEADLKSFKFAQTLCCNSIYWLHQIFIFMKLRTSARNDKILMNSTMYNNDKVLKVFRTKSEKKMHITSFRYGVGEYVHENLNTTLEVLHKIALFSIIISVNCVHSVPVLSRFPPYSFKSFHLQNQLNQKLVSHFKHEACNVICSLWTQFREHKTIT